MHALATRLLSFCLLLSILLVVAHTAPDSASTTANHHVPRSIPTTLPTEVRFTGLRPVTNRAGTNPASLMLDPSSPTPPGMIQTGWLPAGGVVRTLTMTGGELEDVGDAGTSANMENPTLTGTWAGRMTISEEDGYNEGGHDEAVMHGDSDKESNTDILGIAVGASITGLALGALLVWWYFWWRRHRGESKSGECGAWVCDRGPEVGVEKGKVV